MREPGDSARQVSPFTIFRRDNQLLDGDFRFVVRVLKTLAIPTHGTPCQIGYRNLIVR
ncbi:MAG: hypothetical protein BECKG1743D_GA0114223_1000714 [Candidatus Kentron sp. G]|nr:MAG: hypothetical protein BECKG1743F_GA0114225_1000615 [Candidatus Kentron sp. G]VFM95587.1 MAG: hypothetical protein BECKG1743E_GA0114224_1000715 [Candidatus Kentron sp. G]VFM97281.1 MAG: hypothetical protein BECKG1743D_GA0114223_1000714 [Candidatus Kentron sp. G]